jgi:hypothetical protein
MMGISSNGIGRTLDVIEIGKKILDSQVYPPILNKRCRIPVINESTANNTEVNSFFVYAVDSETRSCN